MAEGESRDVRVGTSGGGNQPEQAVGSGEQKRGKFVIVNRESVAATVGGPKPSGFEGSTRAAKRQQSRQQSTATATVTTDVHGDQNSKSQQSGVDSKRTTPIPHGTTSARSYPRKRTVYPSAEDAANTATFLVSAVEVIGVTAVGPAGEMTEFERGMISPPLKRILQRTPLAVVEKASPIIDGCVLILGFGMYASRAFGGVIPKKNPTPHVQEDSRAPQSAPVSQTVRDTKAGDVNGLAVPVPDVLSSHMNGAI